MSERLREPSGIERAGGMEERKEESQTERENVHLTDRGSSMKPNTHLSTLVLTVSDIDGNTPARYRRAEEGQIFAPGLYGAKVKGWGEVGPCGVIVSLWADDDGEWFRDLARQKDPNAVVTEVQLLAMA
jgi:hypothetical protein